MIWKTCDNTLGILMMSLLSGSGMQTVRIASQDKPGCVTVVEKAVTSGSHPAYPSKTYSRSSMFK